MPEAQAGPSGMERLLALMARLRSNEGCPWDRKQTLSSLKPYLIEECYEALEAIDSGDRQALCEELGDVLLQVVFQAQLCAEEGAFTFDQVAHTISDKLVRRHPHIFGEAVAEDAEAVVRNWEAIKRTEKGDAAPRSAVDGVPRSLPALHKADQVQRRAARVGFDWDAVHQVVAKLDEEVEEVKEALRAGKASAIHEEIGDLLFTVVNLSRFVDANAEELLHRTTEKFIRRFKAVERRLEASGRAMSDCALDELDAVWDQVKAAESAGSSGASTLKTMS